MGHDLKFIEFSEVEQRKIEEVLARDEALRNRENDRICTIQSEVENLDNKVDLLAKDAYFKENHCLQCFSQFIMLFNSKLTCSKCQRNFCRKCLQYVDKENIYLCLFCRKKMAADSQKNSWFYENVKNKFKHFGSEKIKRLFSRGKSEGEDNDDDTYERQLHKRPSLGDIVSIFKNSTDSVSDSGFSTASSRRNFTLIPNLSAQPRNSVDSNKDDVDLEVMMKKDAGRSSWNLTPITNRIPFSARDNYSVSNPNNDTNNNINRQINNTQNDRRSSLSSEISDDIIDDIVVNNQFTDPLPAFDTKSRSQSQKSVPIKPKNVVRHTPTPPLHADPIDGDCPVFLHLPEDSHIAEGETAEFACAVEGTLPIEVYWYREGSELIRIDENESEKYVVSKAGRSHGFVILDASVSDRGYYMCIAVNDYGRKEHMVKLTVLDKDSQMATTVQSAPVEYNALPRQKLEIFTPPVALPRHSRVITTEIIRCGDFDVTNIPSPRYQEVFPDIHFVPLTNSEIIEGDDNEMTISSMTPEQSNSYASSSIEEDTDPILTIQTYDTVETNKQYPAEKLRLTGPEISKDIYANISSRACSDNLRSTSSDESCKSTVDSIARHSYNGPQIDVKLRVNRQSNNLNTNHPILDNEILRQNSSEGVRQFSFKNTDNLRNTTSDSIFGDTNLAAMVSLDKKNQHYSKFNTLPTKHGEEVDSGIYYQENQYLNGNQNRGYSSENSKDGLVKREEGQYILKSSANKGSRVASENVSFDGEEDVFYLSMNQSEKSQRPSVKELTKKYAENYPPNPRNSQSKTYYYRKDLN